MPKNVRGHMTLATPPFEIFFMSGTLAGSKLAKFEVRIFSHFGTISI